MRIMGRAAVLLALLAAAPAAQAQEQGQAQAPGQPQTQPQPHDRLVVGMGSFPASLHPLIGGQASRDYLLGAARRRVTNLDAQGRNVCQLCTEVPSVANGRVRVVDLPEGGKGMEVTFTLRPGLKWGDGTPLTTRDILFGAEVARSTSPQLNVAGVVAQDERSYTVTLNAVRFDAGELSPQPVNAAVEAAAFHAAKDPQDYANASAFSRAPGTPGLWNGPYVMTGFKANESVTFAPNPYWDGETPAFKQVTMRLIPSGAAVEANLLSGDIDVPFGMGFDQVTDLETRHADRFNVVVLPGTLVTNYLYLQGESPILGDKRVRQAIAMGLDKQTMVDRLFGGRYVVANSFVATADPNYAKGLKPWPYDPARARATLAEAGWTPGADGVMQRADGTRLSLDLIAGAGAATAGLVQQVVQSAMKQIGIEVVAKQEPFRVLDGTTLRRRLFQGMVIEWDTKAPGAFPLTRLGSAGIPREANAFSGWNVTGYSNPRVDALMRDGLAELDLAKRQAMWDEMQEIVMDDLPQVPLYNEAFIYVSPTWMTGFTPPRSVYQPTLWIEHWKLK